jgi:rhamnulokinase
LCADLGISPVAVVAPATHDTASAVAGTPLEPGWAYISSGTWSLVGVERRAPLLSLEAMRAGLTNERGVGRTIRLLTNVMGLWLL